MYNLENKICSFNVNEYHLVTILMPYIYEKSDEEKKIITFFERDLKDIYEKVLNTNSLFWKNREVFDKIDWKKIESQKLAEKFNGVKDKDIVIIAGTQVFVERINRLALNFHINFTLVNCFELENLDNKLEEITKNYGKILCTKGIKEIKEFYLV